MLDNPQSCHDLPHADNAPPDDSAGPAVSGNRSRLTPEPIRPRLPVDGIGLAQPCSYDRRSEPPAGSGDDRPL